MSRTTMTRCDDIRTPKKEKKIWDALQVFGPGTKAIVANVRRNGLSEADVMAWVKYWTAGKEINKWGVGTLGFWLNQAKPGQRPPTTKSKDTGPNLDLVQDRNVWKRKLNALPTEQKQRLAEYVRDALGNRRAVAHFDRFGDIDDTNADAFIQAYQELEAELCQE